MTEFLCLHSTMCPDRVQSYKSLIWQEKDPQICACMRVYVCARTCGLVCTHRSAGKEHTWRWNDDLLIQATLADAVPFLPSWDLRKQHGRPDVNMLGVFPLFQSSSNELFKRNKPKYHVCFFTSETRLPPSLELRNDLSLDKLNVTAAHWWKLHVPILNRCCRKRPLSWTRGWSKWLSSTFLLIFSAIWAAIISRD